jgi:hypothetical protein
MKLVVLTIALFTGTVASAQLAPMQADETAAAQMATAYPPCSRTVQDQCLESSARESDTKGGPPAHMPMMHHRHMMKHHRHMMKHHHKKM